MDKEYITSVILSGNNNNDKRLIREGDYIDFGFFKALCECKGKNLGNAFFRYDSVKNSKGICYQVEIKCPSCGGYHVRSLNKTQLMTAINYYRKCLKGDVWKYPVFDPRDAIHCDDCKEIRFSKIERELDEKKDAEKKKRLDEIRMIREREENKQKLTGFVWKGENL